MTATPILARMNRQEKMCINKMFVIDKVILTVILWHIPKILRALSICAPRLCNDIHHFKSMAFCKALNLIKKNQLWLNRIAYGTTLNWLPWISSFFSIISVIFICLLHILLILLHYRRLLIYCCRDSFARKFAKN